MKILITCQYYENYAINAEGEITGDYWKAKGGSDFVAELPNDMTFAPYEVWEEVAKSIFEKPEYNNRYCRYEVVNIEPCYNAPEDVTEKFKAASAEVEATYNKIKEYEEEYENQYC